MEFFNYSQGKTLYPRRAKGIKIKTLEISNQPGIRTQMQSERVFLAYERQEISVMLRCDRKRDA